MPTTTTSPILHLIRQALQDRQVRECGDRELLERFLRQHDELAFEAILSRHGPMVLDVCRALLPNEADAEDAFQATFLVLARRAGSIRETGTLGGFLHGVACRTAFKARAQFCLRRKHEARAAVQDVAGVEVSTWSEVRHVLHEELSRLAERHRLPLVLCYLQGQTQDQAAALLGLSKGTLKRRLESGRALLRERLVRRGVGPAGVLLAAAWPATASAVPAALLRTTAQVGRRAANLSTQVLALAEGTARSAFLTPVKVALAALLVLGIAGAGLALSLAGTGAGPPSAARAEPAAPPEKQMAGKDRYGDPLPARAVARLGTGRFRSDSWVSRVVVVPGGKQLLGLGGRAVILWDAASGKEVRRFEGPTWRNTNGAGYGVRIESLAVSPDGKTLAAGTTDGSKLVCPILLFDLATGKKRGELPGHKGDGWSANNSLAFVTPALLVSCGADGRVIAWDMTGKQEVRRLETPNDAHIWSLVPVPDHKHVVGTGSHKEKGTWVVWDVGTGKVVRRESGLPGHFVKVAVSPDGKTLAVSIGIGEVQKEGGSNEVRTYTAPDWKEKRRWRTHAGSFPQRNGVAFAPDGKRIATGGADQKARQWDLEGKEVAPAIEPYRYANHVAYLDTDTLITFDAQSVVKFWSTTTGKPKLDFVGSEGHLATVAFSPDGRYVASGGGGGDATVRVWEAATGKQVARLQAGMSDVTCVQFSPDGKWIASADSSGVARVWDWARGRVIHAFRDHKGWLYSVAFSPDGKRLATGDNAGVVRVWDLANGKVLHTLRGHTAHVTALVFGLDGRTLISGSWDHSIRLWDLATQKATIVIKGVHDVTGRQTPAGHTNVVTSLALSPGGRYLYSGSYDHRICVWETSSGQLCRILKGQERGYSSVEAIALSPDGSLLAAAIGDEGQESSVHVWDVLAGKKIAALPGHRGKVTRLAWSPDGRRLASCSTDTTVLVWDVAGLSHGRPAAGAKALASLWEDLAADAPDAYAAVCRGAAVPEATVAVLKGKLKPLAAVDRAKFDEWARQLDSEQMADRERASRALADLGVAAEPLLRKTAAQTESAEVRARVKRLLAGLEREGRRSSRAVEMLVMIGTSAARRILADLARGDAGAALTREAAAALKRLDGRK
jgi:RNA polymerase sigma factor (sigma-70 family)